ALVGRTGAGKTSALHLLAGLYAPWAGAVRIAGLDPSRLGEAERRSLLGVVPQVVQLFSGTLHENLTLGDASAPQEAVVEAAAVAGLDAFVRSLPMGYQTVLGHGSGGPWRGRFARSAEVAARAPPPGRPPAPPP